jgi:hypothetical protein
MGCRRKRTERKMTTTTTAPLGESKVISGTYHRVALHTIYDKLGVESRPVIAAALWMRTAPAQIGGLEG